MILNIGCIIRICIYYIEENYVLLFRKYTIWKVFVNKRWKLILEYVSYKILPIFILNYCFQSGFIHFLDIKKAVSFILGNSFINWADRGIRTHDPEITNHVLWPTELYRQMGKLSTSRRYNQTTLAAVKPWGIRRELTV